MVLYDLLEFLHLANFLLGQEFKFFIFFFQEGFDFANAEVVLIQVLFPFLVRIFFIGLAGLLAGLDFIDSGELFEGFGVGVVHRLLHFIPD